MRIRFEPRAPLPARPPESVDAAVREVREATGLDVGSARVRLGFSRGHLLHAVVASPGFQSSDDPVAHAAAELLLARLLGDEIFDDWVSEIQVMPARRPGSLRVLPEGGSHGEEPRLALDEVRASVEAAIAGVHAGLSEKAHDASDGRAEWTLLETEALAADDYAAQDDLVLFSTCMPEAAKCFLEGAPFSSKRFSRHGEVFAYVKTDALGSSVEDRHRARLSLEDAIDGALRPRALGAVVGAGTGLRYVYVGVALSSASGVAAGLEAMCNRLREANVSRRSWVLFYDSDWDGDWVPVWDDSPEPFFSR
jgi:hypothetical protein